MLWSKVQKKLNEKGWSLHKFSKIVNIPYTTLRIYKFKGSEPSFTNACKIADALGVKLDDLRGDKNEYKYRSFHPVNESPELENMLDQAFADTFSNSKKRKEKENKNMEKDVFEVKDLIQLVGILTDEKYSYNFIKEVIHELDEAFSDDIENVRRERIVNRIVFGKHAPDKDEFAEQVMFLMKDFLESNK